MPNLSCPSAKQLSLLISGMLPEPPADEVATHVNDCETCARMLAVLPAQDGLALSVRRAARLQTVKGDTFRKLRDELAKLPDKVKTVSEAQDQTVAIERPRPLIEQELKLLLDSPQSDDELGRIGEYRVLKVLGRGGMGLVLLAEDSSLRRLVALKLMQSQLMTDPDIVARFEREARATAAVRSDHVVSIFSVEQIRTNIGLVPCMAMEYLQGESLEARLKRGPLSVDEVLLFGVQIASGLAAVHATSLIHRDIKPGNLWLEPVAGAEGTSIRAKLLDFGLAHAGLDAAVLTQFGAIIGTPAYMSPEQASGKEVDVRSDLFSLGAVLYEMTTGQKPFRGPNTMAVLMALAGETPPAPTTVNSAIPQQLSQFILRLLEKTPAARPANAQAVVEELRTIRKELRGAPVLKSKVRVSDHAKAAVPSVPKRKSVSRGPRPQTKGKQWFRHRTVALAALGTLGLLVYLAGLLLKVETPQGTLVIETDDDSVEVRVTKNGATIIDRTKDRKLKLAVGKYGIELVNKVNGLTLSAETITITRDDQPPIRIRREKPIPDSSKDSANAAATVETKTGTSAKLELTRRFVVWALSRKGSVIPPGGGDPLEKLREGSILHLVDFREDPALVKPLEDADLDAFKDFPGVENALGFRFQNLTPAGLIQLGALIQGKPINGLGLVDMPIGLSGFRKPGGFAAIRGATLQNIDAQDADLVHLQNLPLLAALNLRFNKHITDAGVDHLAKLKTLKTLNLEWTGVTAAGIAKLRAALPECAMTSSFDEPRRTP